MKKFTIFICLLFVLSTAAVFVGCNKDEHIHSYTEKSTEATYLFSEATCTKKAKYYYSCSCGEKGEDTFEYGEAKGHNVVTDEPIPPTATTDGSTGGKHCADCGIVLEEPKIIPATGSQGLEFDGSKVVSVGTCSDENIVIPKRSPNGTSVTEIGDKAFENTSAVSISIPDSVTKIGNEAFINCSNLTQIHIPSSVDAIGANIFRGSHNLTTVYYDSSYVNIDNRFMDVENIKKIVFGSAYIPDNVLKDHTFVTEIIMSDNVIEIGGSAFSGCKALTEIKIGDNVTKINYQALYGCSGLKKLTIGKKLSEIGEAAFSGCVALENIVVTDNERFFSSGNCLIEKQSQTLILGCESSVIPSDNSVTKIGNNAFSGCVGLTNIEIPDSVTTVYPDAFGGCTSLKSIDLPSVTEIGIRAFAGCTSLESVTLSNALKTVAQSAFVECKSLKEINFPDSVTKIGDQAFEKCTSLISVTIGGGLSEIGTRAFAETVSLEKIIVSVNNAKYIGEGNCLIEKQSKILVLGCRSSDIPSENSVTEIGESAFYNCSDLSIVIIPDSVTKIGKRAFFGCSSLSKVIGGNGLKAVGEAAFETCAALTDITLKDGLTTIGRLAFRDCESLTSISIPNSVTELGGLAFKGCKNLEEVVIGNGVTQIMDLTFDACKALKRITIGSGVVNISYSAFNGCTEIESITVAKENTKYHSNGNCIIETQSKTLFLGCRNSVIPSDNSVTKIGDNAFFGCKNLTYIVIPSSVTEIGDKAFYNCENLKTIYYNGTKEQWNNVSVKSGNTCINEQSVYFFSASEPSLNSDGTAYDGNYWYYADGATPKVWKKQ